MGPVEFHYCLYATLFKVLFSFLIYVVKMASTIAPQHVHAYTIIMYVKP